MSLSLMSWKVLLMMGMCESKGSKDLVTPYRADYFGHKLHLDQNEKLVMYAAINGHSRFLVSATTIPIKCVKWKFMKIFTGKKCKSI